jgi:hypothetical protein
MYQICRTTIIIRKLDVADLLVYADRGVSDQTNRT